MSVPDFEGKTFVAFVDLSGFKKLVRKDKKNATKALDKFYQTVYNVLDEDDNKNYIHGVLVSDCGILYCSNKEEETKDQLNRLLKVIKKINKIMLCNDFLLKTSISYGDFKYKGKFEFDGIEKNPIHGNAYLNAYLDSESKERKLNPGECRVILDPFPYGLESNLDSNPVDIFKFLKKFEELQYYYFYWMLDDPSKMDEITENYKTAYESRYKAIKKVLKNYM